MTSPPIEHVREAGLPADLQQSGLGQWFLRCPALFPVNAQHWRGPFIARDRALSDLKRRAAQPRPAQDGAR